LLLLIFAAIAAEPTPVLELADAEIDRVLEALADAEEAPYYMAYGLVDNHNVHVAASNGALWTSRDSTHRYADIDIRVGDPELDNTHKIRDASWFSEEPRSLVELPADGDPYATQTILWRETDEAWQRSVRRLTKVRANESVKVEREDASADFSLHEPVVDIRERQDIQVDIAAWEDLARDLSSVFLEVPGVIDSGVDLRAEAETFMFTDSDGALLQHSRVHYRISVWARGRAHDGMTLEVHEIADSATLEGLPDRESLMARAEWTAKRTADLTRAPMLEPFTGPAILKGKASGVFFHEVFGHRMEGHRQKDEDEGQTFTDMVGEAILPEFLSVADDPTQAALGAVDLNGHYPYDDEGVPGQRVQLVDHGVLQTFLLSRMPIDGWATSNGHGRRQPGNDVVARQGNLMVEAHETVSEERLREMLIEEIKAQDAEFGLIVEDITGGFTLTGRVIPNSFNVRPVSVWKVFPDGRPDELVRGGDLIGTPLTVFNNILAASDEVEVFNGVCGAESGWVPVSASAPSLLLKEIEVQRKEKGNDRPPLLDAPGKTAAKEETSA
jgi:TldD protein